MLQQHRRLSTATMKKPYQDIQSTSLSLTSTCTVSANNGVVQNTAHKVLKLPVTVLGSTEQARAQSV